MKKKNADVLHWILIWIIVLIMEACFLLAPFFAIAIMHNNVSSGVTQPDMDIQEQIHAEMMIQ